jgi:hypothetical protein
LLVVLGGEWRKLKEIADSGSVDALSLSLSHSLSPNVFEIASLGFIFVVAKGKKEKPIRLRCWLLRGRTNKKGSKTRRRILLGVKNHLYLKQEESYLGKREREKEREREREREETSSFFLLILHPLLCVSTIWRRPLGVLFRDAGYLTWLPG